MLVNVSCIKKKENELSIGSERLQQQQQVKNKRVMIAFRKDTTIV